MIRCAVAERYDAPIFRFGLVSDIQYADFDDGHSAVGKRRYYRAALPSLERAVSEWNAESVDFAIQCGDIVDGVNRTNKQSTVALQRILGCLDRLNVECKHVLGNHCTCQFQRKDLLKKLHYGGDDLGYYSFEPTGQWRLVVLDTSDISLYAWPKDHPHHHTALEIMKRENPNDVWCNPSLLKGKQRRFCSYNGAVGNVQLKWLESELEAAAKLDQNVLIFTHIPIEPQGVTPGGILWNFEEVQTVLRRHASRVRAVFSGHVHQWVHSQDRSGIQYITLPGVIEMPPGTESHGIVDVHDASLVIRGFARPEPLVLRWSS